MTSTSTYGSTLSGGTQGVIDDIADRRYRTHFLKDRSASNARINLRGDNGEDKRASYKAWGRTQSGILAESLMTPKEINLIWGWYSPIMSANSKYDVVDVNILISQFMSAGTFDTLGDANNFMRSIKRRQEGAVSFAELTTAIANYDVSTEHVFELRQFAKKLKAIKKDKKSRPLSGKGSGSRVDHVFARGHEEARKSLLSKAKSENHVGVFPTLNLTPVVADSDDSSANLPVINSGRGQRQRETLPDHTSTSVHSDTMIPTIHTLASQHAPLVKANSRKKITAQEGTNNLSPVDSSSLHSPLPMKLSLGKQGSETDSSLTLSLTPPHNNSSPMKSPQKLNPVAGISPRKRDKQKTVRLQMPGEGQAHLTSQGFPDGGASISPRSGGLSPRNGILKSMNAPPQLHLRSDSNSNNNSGTGNKPKTGKEKGREKAQAPPAPELLQGVRKKFHRQLSRMATNDNIHEDADVDVDVPTKSVRNSKNIDDSHHSFRHNRPNSRDQASARARSAPNAHVSAIHEDEDMPTQSIGNIQNIDVGRNSLRQKRRSSRHVISKMDSASNLLMTINSALKVNKKNVKRVDRDKQKDIHRDSAARHTPDKGTSPKPNRRRGEDGGGGDEDGGTTLTNLRRSFSRQLSKMASMSAEDRSRSPKRSTASDSRSPLVPALRLAEEVSMKHAHSEDSHDSNHSMQSIASFDSGHDLLRFQNHPSSRNSSFGDTILLDTSTHLDLDI